MATQPSIHGWGTADADNQNHLSQLAQTIKRIPEGDIAYGTGLVNPPPLEIRIDKVGSLKPLGGLDEDVRNRLRKVMKHVRIATIGPDFVSLPLDPSYKLGAAQFKVRSAECKWSPYVENLAKTVVGKNLGLPMEVSSRITITLQSLMTWDEGSLWRGYHVDNPDTRRGRLGSLLIILNNNSYKGGEIAVAYDKLETFFDPDELQSNQAWFAA